MSNPQRVELRHGDCIELMRELPDNSIDSIVTDPPYGLGFMGKEWDDLPPSKEWADQCMRVLKPGGHLLAFGGTRTYHRLAVAIEDAGFEIRDSMIWLYGSGFPKSHDVSKAIDKAAGAERERVPYTGGIASGSGNYGGGGEIHEGSKVGDISITPAAQQWSGWGTALKPAHEPIVVARKPLIGTVAENVLEWGVGAMNIDGCRIGTADTRGKASMTALGQNSGWNNHNNREVIAGSASGRWPANVVLSHTVFCDDTCAEGCPVAELDRQSGNIKAGDGKDWSQQKAHGTDNGATYLGKKPTGLHYSDTGGASRFFYVAKASKRERPKVDGVAHPTVKPLALMRWLVRLVTPPNGTVLEPFAGSGTTVEAALLEGFSVLAFEKTADYLPLIRERIRRTDTGATN